MANEQFSPQHASASWLPASVADEADSYRDLCCNCNNGPECGYGQASQRPVFFCEQFDAFLAPPPISPRPDLAASPVHPGPDRPIGLCANCDNADTCTNSQTEGGVWHCQEYR